MNGDQAERLIKQLGRIAGAMERMAVATTTEVVLDRAMGGGPDMATAGPDMALVLEQAQKAAAAALREDQ